MNLNLLVVRPSLDLGNVSIPIRDLMNLNLREKTVRLPAHQFQSLLGI